MNIDIKKVKAIVGTYLALAIPAVLATAMAGQTEPKTLILVAAAAVMAPLARGFNKNDPAYGIVKEANEVVQAKAKKAVAKKK
jgi:hypothetical protein